MLGQHRAGDTRARLQRVGHQDHHAGGGTDQDSVDEHAQCLHEALRGRMVRAGDGHSRDVRCGTHAGLVGIQATLDAVEHGSRHAAHQAACRLIQTESAAHDQNENVRDLVDIGHQHPQGHAQIGHRHERHHHLGHTRDVADAAEDHDAREHGHGHAHLGAIQAEGFTERLGNGVGLHGVEHQTEHHQQRHREHGACPRRLQATADVEGRAAAVETMMVIDLVELRQRTFRVGRGHAQQGHDPHPEERPGATGVDRHGHAGDVAGPHPRGQAGGQCLDGGDALAVLLGRAGHRPDEFPKTEDLQKAQTDREIDAYRQQAVDQNVAPDDRVDRINRIGHGVGDHIHDRVSCRTAPMFSLLATCPAGRPIDVT